MTCFTIDGMSILNIFRMLKRYFKTFGKFPKHRTPFKLNSLMKFTEDNGFKVYKAELLGNKAKAIFVKATKK